MLCPELYKPTRQALWLLWGIKAYQLPVNPGTGGCLFPWPGMPVPNLPLFSSGELLFIFQKPAQISFLKFTLGFPWWFSGYETAWRGRGHGFNPCSRKIPHASEQLTHALQLLSPHILLSPCFSREKPPRWEAWAPQWESSPGSPQLEKSPLSNEDPAQPKINNK